MSSFRFNGKTDNEQAASPDSNGLKQKIKSLEKKIKEEKRNSVALVVILIISWMIFFNTIVILCLKDTAGMIGIVMLQVCALIFVSVHFKVRPVIKAVDHIEKILQKFINDKK